MAATFKLTLIAVAVAFAHASCPSGCSGHGSCQEFDKCSCMPRWIGADCASRECAFGLSWVAAAKDDKACPYGDELNGEHAYTECSSRGLCDRDSGECECFAGFEGRGCRRSSCPNDCSGHGRCRYNKEISDDYKFWDADKTRQCECDRGFGGVDCTARICPKGDDPLTECNNAGGTVRNDVQLLEYAITGSATAGECNEGFFTLTFTDMFNGVYTTKPILTDDNVAGAVEAALEELPNFAVPNVTVYSPTAVDAHSCYAANMETDAACTTAIATTANEATCEAVAATDVAHLGCYADSDGTTTSATCDAAATDSAACALLTASGCFWVGPKCIWRISTRTRQIYVEFNHPANSGKQNDLELDVATTPNTANMQPRFERPRYSGTATVVHSKKYISDSASYSCLAGGYEIIGTCTTDGTDQAACEASTFNNCQWVASDMDDWTNDGTSSPPVYIDHYAEHDECSGRGACDQTTGLCECFEGYTGEACAVQTVFF